MPGTVRIEFSSGDTAGQTFAFANHDIWIFGRSPDCHAHLPPDDETASRHHFLLEINPPSARLRDLGSLNGTFVNGIKVGGRLLGETPEQGGRRDYPQVDLEDGDEIRAGVHRLRIQIDLRSHCMRCGGEFPWVSGEGRRASVCDDCAAEVTQGSPLVAVPSRSEPNSAVEVMDLRILSKLGEGSFGAVYLAHDRRRNLKVALKVLFARAGVDDGANQRFQREVEAIRTLRHTNIVELYEYGQAGAAFYFTMELCEGGSLEDLVSDRQGKLPLSDAAPLMLGALRGLGFAHAKGFVHRDLKPANILLGSRLGDKRRRRDRIVKIADLGLAKSFIDAGLSGMTATGTAGGTLAFMPREQLLNFRYVQPASDVWSMAATFYEMLTGSLPREGDVDDEAFAVVLNADATPIREREPRLPREVAQVLDKALATNPEHRFRTAGDMLDALEKAL